MPVSQVNGAGILETGTIENSSLEQFDRVMNVNMRYWLNITNLYTYLSDSEN